MRYMLVIVAGLALIGVGLAFAQIAMWPHRLRLPEGNDWWGIAAIFVPLLAVPLSMFPRIAMPVVLSAGAAVMIFAMRCWQPDVGRSCVCIVIYLGMCIALEPKITSLFSRLIWRFRRHRAGGKKTDPPSEFSMAMVPRGPRKPGPLVAQALAPVDAD